MCHLEVAFNYLAGWLPQAASNQQFMWPETTTNFAKNNEPQT